jgi:hypothetical protein
VTATWLQFLAKSKLYFPRGEKKEAFYVEFQLQHHQNYMFDYILMLLLLFRSPAILRNQLLFKTTMSKRAAKKHIAVEYEDEKQPSTSSDTKKAKFEPKNWKLILENIRKMRKSHPAAVDEMGCEKCSDDNADDKTKRFQILVALMMSSQTKDGTRVFDS